MNFDNFNEKPSYGYKNISEFFFAILFFLNIARFESTYQRFSTETEESDSDPAIDDDDGDDVGSHVIVPDAGEVSLQEHDALPSDNVKSIVDELTKRVFSSIYSR